MALVYIFIVIFVLIWFLGAINTVLLLYIHFKLIYKYGDNLNKIMKNAYYFGELGVTLKKQWNFK